MDFEWSRDDIENARNRTDPDLNDEQIIQILNEAVKRSGQRSGILFNRAVVRVFEEYRDQGLLQEKQKERMKKYQVRYEEKSTGLVDKLRISMEDLLEIIDEFGLGISKDELLENENEIISVIEQALVSLERPFTSSGSVSIIAKRKISQELEEWKRKREREKNIWMHQQQYQVRYDNFSSFSSPSPSKSSSPSSSIPIKPKEQPEVPSVPNTPEMPKMVSPPNAKKPESYVQQRSMMGENRILDQLKFSRLENISLPSSVSKFHLEACYDNPPSNEMLDNFDVIVEFLNFLDEGVRIIPRENDNENDYFVMLGTGSIRFFRKEGKQVIEPQEQKLNLLIFNPEDVSTGCEMELFSGTKNLVLDMVYSRFSSFFEKDNTALEIALKTIIEKRGSQALGLTSGLGIQEAFNELIAKKSTKELVGVIEEHSDLIGPEIARQAIKELTSLSEKIAVYPLEHGKDGIELLALLDFLNRYGPESRYSSKLRRLTLSFTHKQKEMFNTLGEETIKRLRKAISDEGVASVGEIGKIGVLFIDKSNPYPFLITVSSKELSYSVTSPFKESPVLDEFPIDTLIRILINLVSVSHSTLKSLFEPLKIRNPLLKALRKLKEKDDPFLANIRSIDDYLTIPLTVYYYVYKKLIKDSSLANLEKEDIDNWRPQFEKRLCYYLLYALIEQNRERTKIFIKPADPMKKQFPLFSNLDAFLANPANLESKIEQMWEWVHKNM